MPQRANDTGVCEQNTPPDKKTGWKIGFESTKSVAGLQFVLLGRSVCLHRRWYAYPLGSRVKLRASEACLPNRHQARAHLYDDPNTQSENERITFDCRLDSCYMFFTTTLVDSHADRSFNPSSPPHQRSETWSRHNPTCRPEVPPRFLDARPDSGMLMCLFGELHAHTQRVVSPRGTPILARTRSLTAYSLT